MYDISFPQEDWTCVDEDTGIRSITAPTLFSNMVIGNILTIGGVEQKDPAINGIGWLTARRIGYVNGVRTELKRVAVIDNGKFRKGKRKEIAVVESNKRRAYAKSSNTTDTSSTSTYSAPARPNFLG